MSILWNIPPEPLTLDGDEVHMWRMTLDYPTSQRQELFRTLAEDERSRAARFYFQRDRDRFVAARGALRAILGKYLNVEPEQLLFQYNDYGKPRLVERFQKDELYFNVSHSQGMALIAVTRGREVGVDLEWIRPGFASEQIAERFFSPQEVNTLRALPQSIQDEAFFNCWTRKEAYIKAKGEGLSMPLHLFDVSLVPGEPSALLSDKTNPEEPSRWSLRGLSPAPGFVGAVAAEGRDWQLKCWRWPK